MYNNVPGIAAAAGSLASAGGTETLVVDGTGPDLSIKGLTAGTGVTLTGGAGVVTVTNASPASSVTLDSVGVGASVVYNNVGPALQTRGILAGAGMSVSGAGTDVTVTNDSPASSVTLSSAGGTSLVTDSTGPTLAIKGISAASGILVTDAGTALTLTPMPVESFVYAAFSYHQDLGAPARPLAYNDVTVGAATLVRIGFARVTSTNFTVSSIGSNNNVFQADKAGTYAFHISVSLFSDLLAQDLLVFVRHNLGGASSAYAHYGGNSVTADMQMWSQAETTEAARVAHVSGVYYKTLAAGDSIDLLASQGTGLPANVCIMEATMYGYRLL